MSNSGGGGDGDGGSGSGSGGGEIHAASSYPRLPMPKFCDALTNLEIYFESLGYWFAACGVTSDERKYNTVMAQVPINSLAEIRAEIGTLPAAGKFEHVRPIIIAYFSESQQKRFREAINDVQLGDTKPSQMYQKMKRLAADSLTETALIDLWAARLPETVHGAVIQMKGSPLKDRLIAADALVEALRLRNIGDVSVNQATNKNATESAGPSATGTDSVLEKLCQQVAELQRNFSEQRSGRSRSQSRDQSQRRRSRSRTHSQSQTEHSECWYHRKHGRNAQHCRTPCSFNTSSGTSSGSSNNNNNSN